MTGSGISTMNLEYTKWIKISKSYMFSSSIIINQSFLVYKISWEKNPTLIILFLKNYYRVAGANG